MKIEIRRGQLRKRDPAGDDEMAAREFAPELLNRKRILRKIYSRLEILDRRKGGITHPRDVDRHIAAPAQNGARDCAPNIDIQRRIAIEIFNPRQALAQ